MIPKLLVAVHVGSEPPGVSPAVLQMLFMTPFLRHLERPRDCLSPGQVAFGEMMVMPGLRRIQDTDLLVGRLQQDLDKLKIVYLKISHHQTAVQVANWRTSQLQQ